MLTLYAFGRVHSKVIGVTRDLRALWMLEECGLPHQVRGLDHSAGELNSEEYRRLTPFAQLPVLEDDGLVLTEAEQARRPGLVKWADRALGGLEEWLSARPYLVGADFTVADILMTTVLREVRGSDVLAHFPRVRAYQQRCEARPAWQRTLEAYEQRLGAKPGSTR